MALTNSYLVSTKNFDGIMNSILGAKAPERFTSKFLVDLGYKSSNDRLIISVLKSLGFLNDTGEPTQRYYDFLDQTQSKKILSIGIQEAYEDLFAINKEAQNLTQEDIKNKLKTLTQGQKTDVVLDNMARTFKTLCDYADWSEPSNEVTPTQENIDKQKERHINKNNSEIIDAHSPHSTSNSIGLHYNIQIHLPETTNMAVYDAIFQSIKNHLM